MAVPNLRGGTDNLFHYAAYLGGYANPFIVESDPNDPKYAVRNLKPPANITLARLEDRRRTLEAIDGLRRDADARLRDHDDYRRRAFEMLTGKAVAKALDINAEPADVRDRYGRHTFGQSALVARRLVEAGTPFVTVNCVPWDHHGTENRMKTEEGARKLIPPLDRAVSALIDDLIARGLYEKTLVVAMGEFGRTPRMNKDGGRDHWGDAFSVLMGCGSMRMGQVIGRSNPRGEYVADRPAQPPGCRRDDLSPRRHRRPIDHLRGQDRPPDLPDRPRRADPGARGLIPSQTVVPACPSPQTSSSRALRAAVASRGDSARTTAALTATRLAPASMASPIVDSSIPPMANQGRFVASAASRTRPRPA